MYINLDDLGLKVVGGHGHILFDLFLLFGIAKVNVVRIAFKTWLAPVLLSELSERIVILHHPMAC